MPSFVSFLFLCQGDDPLGSIHLRGSVVTAVEYVPDGEGGRCHRIHTHTVASPLRQTATRKYNWCLLSVVSPQLIPFNSLSLIFSHFQPRNTTLTATSLRSSPQMRLTTSSKLLQPKKGRSGSRQCRPCQKVENNSCGICHLQSNLLTVQLNPTFTLFKLHYNSVSAIV